MGDAVTLDAFGTGGAVETAVWNGSDIVVGWVGARDEGVDYEVLVRTFGIDGAARSDFVEVRSTAAWADSPTAAWLGDDLGLAFSDIPDPAGGSVHQIFFARVLGL